MTPRIDMQWEVMRADKEWGEMDEVEWPSATPADPQKKHIVRTLLLVAALACTLIVSFWTGGAPPEGNTAVETAAVVYSEPATMLIRQGIGSPRAPLEYWEEKFYQEEVEGRTYTKTPRQYWEDRFFQQEVERW